MKLSILKKILLLTTFSLAATALFANEAPIKISPGSVLAIEASDLKGGESYIVSKSSNPSVRLHVIDAFPGEGEKLPEIFGDNSVYFEVGSPKVLSLISSHIGYGNAAGAKGTPEWMGNALIQETYFKPIKEGSTKLFVRFTDMSGLNLAREVTITVVE